MNAEADQLRKDIATAETRLAELERRKVPAHQQAMMEYQVKAAKKLVSDMRIQLAAQSDLRDNRCPHCTGLKTHSFLVCIPCWREVPFKLWAYFKGCEGLAHAKHPRGASMLQDAKDQVMSHLRQHSSAIV